MSAEICGDVCGGNLTFYDKRNLLVINPKSTKDELWAMKSTINRCKQSNL